MGTIGRFCLLAAVAPRQEQIVENALLPLGLRTIIRIELPATQLIQNFALLVRHLVGFEMLLQILSQFLERVLQQVSVSLEGKFMLVSTLNVDGGNTASQFCRAMLRCQSAPVINLRDVRFGSRDFQLNHLQSEILHALNTRTVLQDGS